MQQEQRDPIFPQAEQAWSFILQEIIEHFDQAALGRALHEVDTADLGQLSMNSLTLSKSAAKALNERERVRVRRRSSTQARKVMAEQLHDSELQTHIEDLIDTYATDLIPPLTSIELQNVINSFMHKRPRREL